MDGEQRFDELSEVPCTVSAPGLGVETDVVGKDLWEQMHKLRSEKHTVSEIARMCGVDRKTVRSCLARSQWRPYQRTVTGRTLLQEHMGWLKERAPQVAYSAQILFQELRSQRGYSGGYDTVRNAVRPLRAEAAAQSLTQRRFETAPGQQAQVDWGQTRVAFADGPAEVHIFVMTLGYSRRAWAEGFRNERLEQLLSAHEHAFEHFGGVCDEMLYDRMRTVVIGSLEGKPRWNETFRCFAHYWGFTPRLCRPYRAQTKGKVESGVKYVKRNFLPGRVFRDLEDFNEQLRCWNAEVADTRVHGTTHQRPIDRFAEEAAALSSSAHQESFLHSVIRDRVVADDWLISIDTNRYSVPWTMIGKTVQVVRVGYQWHIMYRSRLVAEHPILPGRHQLHVLPEHGPGASARNVRRRFAMPPASSISEPATVVSLDPQVEVRDLVVYEQMLEGV
jgi:transposase